VQLSMVLDDRTPVDAGAYANRRRAAKTALRVGPCQGRLAVRTEIANVFERHHAQSYAFTNSVELLSSGGAVSERLESPDRAMIVKQTAIRIMSCAPHEMST